MRRKEHNVKDMDSESLDFNLGSVAYRLVDFVPLFAPGQNVGNISLLLLSCGDD